MEKCLRTICYKDCFFHLLIHQKFLQCKTLQGHDVGRMMLLPRRTICYQGELVITKENQCCYQGEPVITKQNQLLPRSSSCYQGEPVSTQKNLSLPRRTSCYQGEPVVAKGNQSLTFDYDLISIEMDNFFKVCS